MAVLLGAAAAALAAPGLHVSGNRLVDDRGHPVTLRGVNRSGTEYACIQGWGIFDGPGDAVSVRAIASWHVNFVRVPINEDCWLGTGGVRRAYGGARYRRAIVRYVALLHRHHIYPELSLIWAAPGRYRATYQSGAPDEDHSPAVWRSLAATFRHDQRVILAPWGETIVDARCFLKGGVCEATYGPHNKPYRVAGMQQAVRVMRSAGYAGVISIPGLDYANDLSAWLSHTPRDPRHQLIAEAHVYGKNTCSSLACLNRTMAPVGRRVPLIFGELGETYDASSCASTNTSVFLHWARAHHVGTAAWTWDTWGGCGVLIKSYSGTPANAYGRFVSDWYASG
ncbi:MAG: cellulase family glycosylhydrolase [Solirubrobacteraceae bacterium]